jgi:hypothetical protein
MEWIRLAQVRDKYGAVMNSAIQKMIAPPSIQRFLLWEHIYCNVQKRLNWCTF